MSELDLLHIEAELGLKIPEDSRALLMAIDTGQILYIDPADDVSELGASIQWMTTEEVVDENRNYYPGIVALPRGLLAIGKCLEGSGDPYFLRLSDGALVRVPHTAVVGDDLELKSIELVGTLPAILSVGKQ